MLSRVDDQGRDLMSLCEVVLCSTRDVVIHALKYSPIPCLSFPRRFSFECVFMCITKTGIFFFSLKAACCKKKSFVCT